MPLLCSLLCITVIFVVHAFQTRELRFEERKNELRHIDDAGLSIVKQFSDKAASGAMSREDAQKHALERIRGLRNLAQRPAASRSRRGTWRSW